MAIEDTVSELEMPARRRFLARAGGLITGGAVYGLARAMGLTDAWARDYQTVDEILEGTPFRDLDINRYWDEVGQGNVFVFIYHEPIDSDEDINDPNINLARVLLRISSKYQEKVNFLKYHDNPSKTETRFLGLKRSPAWLMYKDGNELYRKEGGPLDEETTRKWITLMENKIRTTYNI